MSNALVINRGDFYALKSKVSLTDVTTVISNPREFFDLNSRLVDRSICEHDNRTLQVLPYVALYDKYTMEIFVYQRGQKAGATALRSMWSFGLGGHIEIAPSSPEFLEEVIVLEACREVEEETGIPHQTIVHDVSARLSKSDFLLMHHNGTPTDQVHLCLSMILPVDRSTFGKLEEGHVENGRWMSVGTLVDERAQGNIFLENWSNILLDMMVKELDSRIPQVDNDEDTGTAVVTPA